ncbi:hypothetical protein BDV95DRAFT_589367 [Massariosphaeria phaeospora]|uniref:Myb-like domain-containing protein n=1 Tax=Massariosphaeria phaeospora TaxID=100035 RepID=A0A7C8IJ22_9PLEO|nr:hypothetical protein BDV95DRAFT_589367 [Massariosphaeria phaeospora]
MLQGALCQLQILFAARRQVTALLHPNKPAHRRESSASRISHLPSLRLFTARGAADSPPRRRALPSAQSQSAHDAETCDQRLSPVGPLWLAFLLAAASFGALGGACPASHPQAPQRLIPGPIVAASAVVPPWLDVHSAAQRPAGQLSTSVRPSTTSVPILRSPARIHPLPPRPTARLNLRARRARLPRSSGYARLPLDDQLAGHVSRPCPIACPISQIARRGQPVAASSVQSTLQLVPGPYIGTHLDSIQTSSFSDRLPSVSRLTPSTYSTLLPPAIFVYRNNAPAHSSHPTLLGCSALIDIGFFYSSFNPHNTSTSCPTSHCQPQNLQHRPHLYIFGTPLSTYGLAQGWSTPPIVDINLLIEPRGSESPGSKKSSTSAASTSTGATRVYTTAPSAYTQSPAYASTSPAYISASPAYAAPSPAYGPMPAYPVSGPTSSMALPPASMQGGPVLPAISELQRHPDPVQHPQFRPLYTGPPAPTATPQLPPGLNGSPPSQLIKRPASQTPLPEESPAKKQSKWTPEEDNLTIELRGQGMKWDDIAKRLPGRSSISCRLRYQNYLEKRAVWDEEKKNKLARLYARFKDQMWQKVATEMGIPWRSAESMHWQLGEQEMSARANAPVFQLHPSATGTNSPPSVPVVPTPHGFTPANAAQLVPNPPTVSPQHHQSQPPPPLPPGPMHSYHHRSDSNQTQSRRRNSSFSRRRTDGRSRSSVPPQLGHTLPQLLPASEADLVSGMMTAPIPETHFGIKRESENVGFTEQSVKRRREEEDTPTHRSEAETRSQGGRSPDRSSQHSGNGSMKSVKREPDEAEQALAEPSRFGT